MSSLSQIEEEDHQSPTAVWKVPTRAAKDAKCPKLVRCFASLR
jgi:hypothetical protein